MSIVEKRDNIGPLGENMSGTDERKVRFDAFAFIPIFPGSLKNLKIRWITIGGLGVLLLVTLGTLIEGTFGRPSDFRLLTDVQYVFSDTVPATPPSFPFIRDISSLLFFFFIVIGFALLHLQWSYITRALTDLRRSGTMVPREQPKSNIISKVLGIDRIFKKDGEDDAEPYTALDRLEKHFGDVSQRKKILLSSLVVFCALVYATLLENSLSRNIFRVLAPTNATAEEKSQWMEHAKQNWWAGQEHPFGLVVYAILTILAMILILSYNVVGLISVYFAIAAYFAGEQRADWFNKDGQYGWAPIAQVFRTVYWSLVLFGAAITTLIAVLGAQMPISVVGLILLYIVLTPVFTVVPWLVFRNVEKNAKQKRRDYLENAIKGIDEPDLEQFRLYVDEFERCRQARIRPMRLHTTSFSALTTVVFLPIILTLLQIYAEVGLGGR